MYHKITAPIICGCIHMYIKATYIVMSLLKKEMIYKMVIAKVQPSTAILNQSPGQLVSTQTRVIEV